MGARAAHEMEFNVFVKDRSLPVKNSDPGLSNFIRSYGKIKKRKTGRKITTPLIFYRAPQHAEYDVIIIRGFLFTQAGRIKIRKK